MQQKARHQRDALLLLAILMGVFATQVGAAFSGFYVDFKQGFIEAIEG